MDSGGRAGQHGDGHEKNVIRFPGNWVDKSELVPFGPSADDPATEPSAFELPEPLTADDFWGEDAGDLHQPVAAPGAPNSEPMPTVPRASVVPPQPTLRRRRSLPSGWRAPAAAAVCVLLGLGVFVSGLWSSGRRGPKLAAHVALQHPTAQGFSIEAELSAVESVIRHAPTPRVSKPRRAAHHRVATTSAVAVSTTEPVSHVNDGTSQSEPVSSSPVASDTAVSSSVSTPATHAASVANSTEPAGPIGPGNAGSNCDPQCT